MLGVAQQADDPRGTPYRRLAAVVLLGALLGAGTASAAPQLCAGEPCDLVLRTLCNKAEVCLA